MHATRLDPMVKLGGVPRRPWSVLNHRADKQECLPANPDETAGSKTTQATDHQPGQLSVLAERMAEGSAPRGC